MRNFLMILTLLGSMMSCNYIGNNVKSEGYIYIKSGDSYASVLSQLNPLLEDSKSFDAMARVKGYPTKVKAGRYKLSIGESNNTIINRLRSGEQTPVVIRISDLSTMDELATLLAKNLLPKKEAFMAAFEQISPNEDIHQVKQYFLMDTYYFNWDTTPEQFIKRMRSEYDRVWTKDNLDKAKSMNMTPLEVASLACIVQKETAQSDELPKVAGLYINRLQDGHKLQADPTVIFAKKMRDGFDQTIKRVRGEMLRIPSPYNTYYTTGLPPAPICFPTKKAIEAVLNHDDHPYIFMCASVDRVGYHEFARTNDEHEVNRQKYIKWINERGIK